VDWSPELADRVRASTPAPKSRALRVALIGLGALVLIVLSVVVPGSPVRRLVARVASRTLATEGARAPEPGAPSVTTLSNRPGDETSPAAEATPQAEPRNATP
jgi:hypothetical protein